MNHRLGVCLTVATLAMTGALLSVSSVHADPSPEPDPTAVGQDQVTQFGPSELEAARARAKERRRNGTEKAERAQERRRFTEAAAERGHRIPESVVQVLDFMDDRVAVVIADYSVPQRLVVRETDEYIELEFDAHTEQPAGGPGMAPWWQNDGQWQYNLIVRDRGEVVTTAQRLRLADDGVADRDYYVYKRKAVAQPYHSNNNWDPSVKFLAIQNAAATGTRPYLRTWMDWGPGDRKGNCDDHPFSFSINVKIVSVGPNFKDCDTYDMTINLNYAGDTHYLVDQGWDSGLSNGEDQQIAYSAGYAVAPGGPTTQNDSQLVRFFHNSNTYECGSTNTSKTC
jgi:hypothetical protein